MVFICLRDAYVKEALSLAVRRVELRVFALFYLKLTGCIYRDSFVFDGILISNDAEVLDWLAVANRKGGYRRVEEKLCKESLYEALVEAEGTFQ